MPPERAVAKNERAGGREESADASSAFSYRAAQRERELGNQRSFVYAMLQFPNTEGGEEKSLGTGQTAGGGQLRFGVAAIAIGMSRGGFRAGATATALGFSASAGGRFTDGQVSTVHKFHN